MTVYLCNGKQPCKVSTGCFLLGGECRRTKNPEFAKNGECDEPEKFQDRFYPISYSNGRFIEWIEKIEEKENEDE